MAEGEDDHGEVSAELESAFAEARRFVREFDPDVIVNFAPDHYNGFFYQLIPRACLQIS